MTKDAVRVEGLSKQYRLGVIGGATFREDFSRWVAKARGRPDPTIRVGVKGLQNCKGQKMWALKDVNLEVAEGSVLGIIGRNGAGKSTLLKILSRITAPTAGRVVIRGRIGSLLEVGTGFHPELTGRENVYLNGAILGMSRAEIARKLDEIVEFAEISQYINTPVKRYSSGMAVRLAFAVAAHLDPEVMIIDEVLAVGDAGFQKKSIGKIGEVSKQGRTVLFVSHNMQSIQSLCSRVILLDRGEIVHDGAPERVCSAYLSGVRQNSCEKSWDDRDSLGNSWLLLRSMRVTQEDRLATSVYSSASPICVEMTFMLKEIRRNLCVGFDVYASNGALVLRTYHTDMSDRNRPSLRVGMNTLTCEIPAGILNDGVYHIAPRIGEHNQEWIVMCDSVLDFSVELKHGESWFWTGLDQSNRPGVIAPILVWNAATR